MGDPWDLQTALTSTIVQPGDTIFLRGGTYGSGTSLYSCRLNGTESNRVYVRQYPGERATVNGGIYAPASSSWMVFWGFEITCTRTTRTCRPDQRRFGLNLQGRGDSVVNMIIHDTGHPGIGFWSPVGDQGEIHGCLIWGVGLYDTESGNGTPTNPWKRGSALYTQNQDGTRYVTDNIMFRNFTNGVKPYTEGGYVDGYDVEGNTLFDTGRGGLNFLIVGTNNPSEGLVFLENCIYRRPTDDKDSVQFGYIYQEGNDADVRDNYMVSGNGSGGAFAMWSIKNVIFTGNTAIAGHRLEYYFLHPQQVTPDWDYNTYHCTGGADMFRIDTTDYNYSGWKAATGFDGNSTASNSNPTTNSVFVRPNQYDDGRGHVTIYNWEDLDDVDVDLSNVLAVGDAYEVRDAQNYYAAPLITGIYDGNPVAFPMDMAPNSVVQPVGNDLWQEFLDRFVHTAPRFAVFVVQLASPKIVWIEAASPNTNENGPGTGLFTVRRSGSTASALTVTYQMSGTATNGTDYAALSGSVVIAASASSATIAVTPLPDTIPVEGDETAIATITSGSYYIDKTAYAATVTIADDTPPVDNTAPSVDAGADGRVVWPDDDNILLDGTVTDDGLPTGAPVMAIWSKDSGPGAVTFASANAVDSIATFSAMGTYVLRLTADDGDMAAYDTVTITVRVQTAADKEMHLKLDNGSGTVATDASGNGHNGAVSGASWISGGKLGKALNFDERNDRVVVNDFALNADFTVAFWFKPTDNNGSSYQYIFSWGTVTAANSINIYLCEKDALSVSNLLRTIIQDGNDTSPTNTQTMDIYDANGFADGQWHHYCLTIKHGVGAKVYIDGSLKASHANVGGDSINPGTDLYLGARYDRNSIRYYGGGLDDVRIYDDALDAYDVADLYGLTTNNTAPSVNAGSDDSVTLPATASLDGTVTDDGSPVAYSLTTIWTKDSGPGTVMFGDTNAVDTTATFSAVGTYVLRLIAHDGDMTAYDTVTIVVSETSALGGDADGDGDVDLDDFGILKINLDSGTTWAQGDFDGDGDVDHDDFAILKANFGKTAGVKQAP